MSGGLLGKPAEGKDPFENMLDIMNDYKSRELMDAKAEISQWKALRVLAENEDLAVTITIAGLEVNPCRNEVLMKLIDSEIAEREKFLNNEPNAWGEIDEDEKN